MIWKEDNTFGEIREKSVEQWLEEISSHEDIVVRGGVKVTREYIQGLKNQIQRLEGKNATKDRYLKKLKSNKM